MPEGNWKLKTLLRIEYGKYLTVMRQKNPLDFLLKDFCRWREVPKYTVHYRFWHWHIWMRYKQSFGKPWNEGYIFQKTPEKNYFVNLLSRPLGKIIRTTTDKNVFCIYLRKIFTESWKSTCLFNIKSVPLYKRFQMFVKYLVATFPVYIFFLKLWHFRYWYII